MKKIYPLDFALYYNRNAIFFSETNIIVYSKKNTPYIRFQDGLECFDAKMQEVFLDDGLLFVELDKLECQRKMIQNQCLDMCSSKVFLRGIMPDDMKDMLSAIQWLTWHRRNKYCGQCGQTINLLQGTTEKKCISCDLSFFPSLSPAVMVLIIKDNSKVLLARSPHFPKGMVSALAGFVDIGETIECAIHREVQEEVGLKIKSLKYFGSQSWPFPNSFMIAFTAEYLEGKIKIDPSEIEDAQWFDINQLPELPAMTSVSRQLIDSVVKSLKVSRFGIG